MLEKLKKEIEVSVEVLNSLPLNTAKNRKSALELVDKEISKYSSMKQEIYCELIKRIEFYKDFSFKKFDEYDDVLSKLTKAMSYTNTLCTPYEKIEIDKAVYQLSHLENDNINKENENILKVINLFSVADISLTEKDFNYTRFVSDYIGQFYKHISDINSPSMKEVFETTYWKCPKIMNQIQLNIRYLYLKNEKVFKKYIDNCVKGIVSGFKKGEISIIDDYAYLRRKRKKEKYSYKDNLVLDFYNHKLDISEFTDIKINDIMAKYFDDTFTSDKIVATQKLLNSLIEYQGYLKYKALIDKIKEAFNDTLEDKFLEKNLKKIAGLEKKLFKLNKKAESTFSKTSTSKVDPDVNGVINEIEQIYKDIDDNLLKIITKRYIKNNSTIFKGLLMVSHYYGILADYFREQDENITYDNIDYEISELVSYIYDPDNIVINNTNLLSEVDIASVIVSNYKQLNIKLDESMLDEANLDAFISDLKKILINNSLKNFEISVLDLENLKLIQAIEEKNGVNE